MITSFDILIELDMNILNQVDNDIYTHVLHKFQIIPNVERDIILQYDLRYLPDYLEPRYSIDCRMINTFVTTMEQLLNNKYPLRLLKEYQHRLFKEDVE